MGDIQMKKISGSPSKPQNRNSNIAKIALIISLISLVFTFLPPTLRSIWEPEIVKFEDYEFETYQNRRFGFEVKYPKAWIALQEPTNGDGIVINELKDSKVEIRVYGRHELISPNGELIDPSVGWREENWYAYIKDIRAHLGLSEKYYETRLNVSYFYDIGGGKKIEFTAHNPAIYIVRYGFFKFFPIKYEVVTVVKGIGYHMEVTVPWYRSYYCRNLISYIISTFEVGPYSGELGANYFTEASMRKVKLLKPKNGEHIKMSYVIISGQVDYPELRPELYINGEIVSYAEDGYFACREDLIPGKNVIKVVEWYKSFGADFGSSEVVVYYDK
jgi:hypothetical protein